MSTAQNFKHTLAWGIPVVMGAILFVQCSSDPNEDASTTMAANGDNSEVPGTATVTGSQLDAEVNAMYDEHDIATAAATNGASTSSSATYTPAKERLMATNDMRGLRSLLVADLEAVRIRLNDGARPAPVREADKALAADLAQGLERVDRALAALGTANDATWASMRDVQLKEVAEVRSWMADYRAKDAWAMN
ncbi:MAG: hypothetical protein JNM62_03920 [Flavobacteriales bacterium]|nr:hypothetical protein [Flavobacteriales bacterium]